VLVHAPDIPIRPSSLAGNLQKHPAVETALRDCEAASNGLPEISFASIRQGEAAQPLSAKERAVARFAVHYALARLWHASGIVLDEACGEAEAVVAAVNERISLREALLTVTAETERKPGRADDVLETPAAAALERGVDAVIVLGPFGGLSAIENSCRKASIPCLPSLGEVGGGNDWTTLLHSLAELYVLGANVNWKAVHAARERRQIVIPPYPWQRVRYWPTPDVAKQIQTIVPAQNWEMRKKRVTLESDL
jgi:acyl transferase domain-containing protein